MNRVSRILIVAVVIALSAGLGYSLRGWLSPEPPGRFLPLQLAPADYSKADANDWRQRLLQSRNREQAPGSGARDLLVELVLDRPALLADPDLAATAARMVAAVAESRTDAVRLCLAFRWSPARLQPMAESCRRALERADGPGARALVGQAPDGLLVIAPPGGLGDSIEAYLRNPYHPEFVYAAALGLARKGHVRVAARLYDELLQLDAGRAARLQSDLGKIRGVRHQSHELQ